MHNDLAFTHHARDRMVQRSIPPGIVDWMLEYGESRPCRDGAVSYQLSKDSLKCLRRYLGRGIADAAAAYRQAYVVVADGAVLTAAFARSSPASGKLDRRGRASK